MDCFSGANIRFIRLVNEPGRQSVTEAYVGFASAEDCDIALKRNWEVMGRRYESTIY